MVKDIFNFLERESKGLHSAAYLLGTFAILSQLLAFVRDRLLAHIFGASHSLDIYYAAFRIPDFIFVTIASIVSLSVLVPFIVEREKLGKEEVRKFLDNIFSFFCFAILISCGLAFFLMPYLSLLLFKGFSPEALVQVTLVSRILLISPIVLGFSNLLGSITQTYNRFALYASAPLLYNAGIILGIVLFAREWGPMGVALGVALGAILHALIQVPFVVRQGLFPRLRLRLDTQSIKKVVMLSLPRTFSLSMSHVASIFLVSLASLMVAGSISVFSLSSNLQSVPLTIIGASYSLAAFPTLSRYFSLNNMTGFLSQMITTARHIIFWALPLSALFIVIRAQIVRVLLGSGNFDWSDTRLTAASLALFVVSAVCQCLTLLFVRALYSAGHTLKPFILNLFSMLVLVVSTYALVKYFYISESFSYFVTDLLKVGDLSGTVVLMLPLGFSIGAVVNCVLHWIAFERLFRGFTRGVFNSLFHSFSTAILMGAVAYWGLGVFSQVFDLTTLHGIFLQGFSAGLLAIGFGIILNIALKSQEIREVSLTLHNKFWRTQAIATDPEII